MNKYVITSMHASAGKTSLIIGLAKALGGNVGYIKPFGERLIYHKKRLWDYDAALIANIFQMDDDPEEMSIGFHHAPDKAPESCGKLARALYVANHLAHMVNMGYKAVYIPDQDMFQACLERLTISQVALDLVVEAVRREISKMKENGII